MSVAGLTLVERLKADLQRAMKERASVRVSTLRTMLSALDNAGAVKVDTSFVPLSGITPDVPRRELSEEEQLAILRLERDSRRSALEQYRRLNKVDVVTRLCAELEVFDAYLSTTGD